MSQHDYVISNAVGAPVRADINSVLDAIKTNNSGTTAPSPTSPYMWWADTTAGIMKQRNAADTAWISRFAFDATLLSSSNNLSDLSNQVTAFNNIKQSASTTTTGVVEKATPTETANGTADKYPDSALIKSVYAPLNSPALTGTPTAPTPTAGDNSTKIATTEFVQSSSGISQGTVVTTTGGVSIDFTSIPATAKRITLMLDGVSTNGTSNVIIQLGDSGGFEGTGYISTSQTAATSAGATTGFQITNGYSASDARSGLITLINLDDNTWVYQSAVSTGSVITTGAGSKTLSDALDRVRITTINGSDTFDAVKVNIAWE